MAIQSANHIAEVSLQTHFQASETNAPAAGKIEIRRNVYSVTFADGQVHAKFLTGNAFTNFFRSKTLGRFTRTLQAQYDTWLDRQRQIEQAKAAEFALTLGFKDNPNVPKVLAAVDEFKAILEEANPAGKEKFLSRLDDIARLATLRNTFTRIPDGAECNRLVTKANFLTHFDDNTKGLDNRGKKAYMVNTLDEIVNGFLTVVSKMEDKKTEIVEFLLSFDGSCVEQKNDNIQDWLSAAAGIGKVSRSNPSHDLAYSAAAEFAVIAEDVREPYYEEARKSCEAEVRAACAKKGITSEAEIKDKIDAKAAMLVLGKDDEVKLKIRQALEKHGKFALYEALVGAKRPVTEIAKNPETGKWTVTTLVDKNGAPVLKPVSAFDIDKNFSKLVDMYLEDAVDMGMVEHKTATEEPVYATREDFRQDAVLAEAAQYASGEADIAVLADLVKAQFAYQTDLPDEEFKQHIRTALDEILATKKDDPAETRKLFTRFAINHADASYFDQRTDLARLANLVARRAEALVDLEKKMLAQIPDAAFRCAKMMQNAFKQMNMHVYTASAKRYIEQTLTQLVHHAYHGKPESRVTQEAKSVLNNLMINGTLFTDNPVYDLGHRAAGGREVKLHDCFKLLMRCMQRYALAPQNYYMKAIKG